MSEQSVNLTARQWRALEAMVQGRSYADAAQAGEVSPRRLYEWRQQPAFHKALQDAQAGLHERVSGRLEALADAAVDRLARVLEKGEDRVAVRAALGVLDRAGYAKPSSPAAVAVAGTHAGEKCSSPTTEELEERLRLARARGQLARDVIEMYEDETLVNSRWFALLTDAELDAEIARLEQEQAEATETPK